jgi:glycosyltransferase involved in cell wall biosynthesis
MKLLILTQKIDRNDPILGFFHRWVEAFAAQCEVVTVICLFEGTHDLPNNVRVLSLGKERGASRLAYLWRFFLYIWRERKQYERVFVHMNQIYIILGGLLWRAMGKRVALWYAHGAVPFSLYPAVLFSHTVFTSTPHGFRMATAKKRIMGQGIDVHQFAFQEHTSRSRFDLITVGRISPIKNLEVLIDAVAMIHQQVPCTFSIVGDADTSSQRTYKEQLMQQIRERNIEDVVLWKGGQMHDTIPQLIGAHDVFVHASRTGSLDKTVLEALAVGTLPVTCNETLALDLPEELRRICVVPPGEVQAYVRALMTIRALSESESKLLRVIGREYVEHHHALSRLVPRILEAL